MIHSDGKYFLYRLSRHCKECKFDVCRVCFHRHTIALHQHPLFRVDSHYIYPHTKGGWFCNNCKSRHHDPADNWPWHCHECNYDLCDNCIGATLAVKTGEQACDKLILFIIHVLPFFNGYFDKMLFRMVCFYHHDDPENWTTKIQLNGLSIMRGFRSSNFCPVTDNWELTVKIFTLKCVKDNQKEQHVLQFRYISEAIVVVGCNRGLFCMSMRDRWTSNVHGGSQQSLPSSKWRVSKLSSRLFCSLVLANVLVI